ncbi:MAG: sterol desaturase family protein [Bacteroidota bacterium]
METYATVLSYAIPGFVGLIIIEAIVARFMGLKINRDLDIISSLSSGMTNTLKSILGLSVIIISYSWMEARVALFEIEPPFSWWVYVIAFIGIDFASYWSHRFNHVINLFWNRHLVHHSSEEFNLSCALRQTISDVFGVYFFLYLPMALIGVPPVVVAILAPLHLFAQFWYHTRVIKRMGFLEHILVTPSHHRVHHAINAEYIDKNYAAIFILWDKWFGTFQEELEEVPPVYGTKRPAGSWNPFLINFMHVWMLAKDAWRTHSWWDKLRLWFMPTGWRPADVKDKYPVYSIDDVSKQVKYDTPVSPFLRAWAWIQLVVNNLLMYFLLANIGDYVFSDVLLYCAFLAMSIFAYTSLMDRHILAIPMECAKFLLGGFLVYHMDGWYGIDSFIPSGTMLVAMYCLLSVGCTFYFTFSERIPQKSLAG